jgi:hypothetical protein
MDTEPNVKSTLLLIQRMMDVAGDPDSYGVSIMVNGFGRFVAKIVRKHGVVVAVYGDTVEEAVNNLLSEMMKVNA